MHIISRHPAADRGPGVVARTNCLFATHSKANTERYIIMSTPSTHLKGEDIGQCSLPHLRAPFLVANSISGVK